jgi:hypothetical protein
MYQSEYTAQGTNAGKMWIASVDQRRNMLARNPEFRKFLGEPQNPAQAFDEEWVKLENIYKRTGWIAAAEPRQ